MGISIADFNNDGWQDVFIANDTEPNSLFINQGNGTFEERGLELGVAYNDNAHTGSSMGSDAKDYDNDGNVDIFYNNLKGQIWQLLRNSGNLFTLPYATKIQTLSRPYSGWSNGFIDYNNDGWKDIYSANGDVDDVNEDSPEHDTMFENVDGKSFVDVSAEMGKDFLHKGYQRGSAFGDLNNDGSLDIVVTSLNEKPRILMNTADSGNHWLMLSLVGAQERARCHWRKGEVDDGLRPGSIQPRRHQRGIHVLQRQARSFRFGPRDQGQVPGNPLAQRDGAGSEGHVRRPVSED